MLLNPYQSRLSVIPGTRMLDTLVGVEGVRIPDPFNRVRLWEVQTLYAPIPGRALGGVRAKLVDQKGFVTFCNQRDLETLLGIGIPGAFCPWSGRRYVAPNDQDWFGLCADEEDLLDDLYERECLLRASQPLGCALLTGTIQRRVHLSEAHDAEDTFVLLQDMDFETGLYPDTRFATLERRWARAERMRVRWERC